MSVRRPPFRIRIRIHIHNVWRTQAGRRRRRRPSSAEK